MFRDRGSFCVAGSQTCVHPTFRDLCLVPARHDCVAMRVCLVGRRVIKRRGRSDNALRLLARWFLVLIGAVAYHQYSQDNHYQEQLRAACAATGGKIALTNLCIKMNGLTPRYRLPRHSWLLR